MCIRDRYSPVSRQISGILPVYLHLSEEYDKIRSSTEKDAAMKIKTVNAPLDKVLAKNPPKHKPPRRPNLFFRTLLKLASVPDLRDSDFTYTQENRKSG